MTHTELAWLAGYFEGEGCFYVGPSGPQRPYAIRISASVVSVDEDVMIKAASLMGVVMQKPRRITNTGKQVYTAGLSGIKAVTLMKKLLPYMGKRRSNKIKEIIVLFNNRPGCPWGENNGHAKLTVNKIRILRKLGAESQPRGTWALLSRRWGVTQTAIFSALHGKTWAKVQ